MSSSLATLTNIMNRELVEKNYRDQGLEIEYGFDKPGIVYEPHRHEKTWLYTLDGSLLIRLDEGEWQLLTPGTEFIVGEQQLHEARVGDKGWEYIAAWEPEE